MIKNKIYQLFFLLFIIMLGEACHPEYVPKCLDPYFVGKFEMSLENRDKIPYAYNKKFYVFDRVTSSQTSESIHTIELRDGDHEAYNAYIQCPLDTSVYVEAYYQDQIKRVIFNFYELPDLIIDYEEDYCGSFRTMSKDSTADVIQFHMVEVSGSYYTSVDAIEVSVEENNKCGEDYFEDAYVGDVRLGDILYNDVYFFISKKGEYNIYYNFEFGVVGYENHEQTISYYLKRIN